MSPRYSLTIAACLFALLAHGQLVISEIMYNPPESMTDSLEFIEVYNAADTPVNVENYVIRFSNSTDTLRGMLAGKGFFVTAVNDTAFRNVYGRLPDGEWNGSGLSNGGRLIELVDATGVVVTSVAYSDRGDWPGGTSAGQPDGGGASIELCDVMGSVDEGTNWRASTTSTGVTVNGAEIFASPYSQPACVNTPPAPVNYRKADIASVIGIDAQGTLDSIGATVELEATVTSLDFDGGNGLEFYMQESTGGIRVASTNDPYTPTLGDVVRIFGTIEQRNGSAQIAADSISNIASSSPLLPAVVTTLDESTQGQLVQFEDVRLVDSTEWQTTGNFNVRFTNGPDTFTLRIDSDTDIQSFNFPSGTFDLTGIANQFDSSAPFDKGYQLLPRQLADFDPFVPGVEPDYENVLIADLKAVNAMGVAVRNGDRVRVGGIVLGNNLRPSGLQFAIVSLDNVGIGVFSQNETFNYAAAEGDSVLVEGVVEQFMGLTQIAVDNISLLSSGNPVPAPTPVTAINESTESSLVQVVGNFPDVSNWSTTGSFNIRFAIEGADTITVRIDSDADVSGTAAPVAGGRYRLTGIGGQFDNSSPFDGSYQLFPRRSSDLDFSVSTTVPAVGEVMQVFAEAEGLSISVLQELAQLIVYDMNGRVLHAQQRVGLGQTTAVLPPTTQVLVVQGVLLGGQRVAVRVLR